MHATMNDRTLPHDLSAEKSVLGALIINNGLFQQVYDVLRPEDFYRDAHRRIFQAIIAMSDLNEAVDLITLRHHLDRDGVLEEVGGVSYISALTDGVPRSANVTYYARIVKHKAHLRAVIRTANDMLARAYDDDLESEKVVEHAERAIFALSTAKATSRLRPLRELVPEFMQRVEANASADRRVLGLTTGLSEFDQLVSGLRGAQLVIVAARPGMGKSAWAMNVATHVARHEGKAVAIFSLEMSGDELTGRLLSSDAGVSGRRLQRGDLSEVEMQRLGASVNEVMDLPLYVDDTVELSMVEVRAKLRAFAIAQQATPHPLGLVVVDYVQLAGGDGRAENRTLELAAITRGLKKLAKELNVPVVALSQLSREIEKRADKRPVLSDLRESGCVTGDTLVFDGGSGAWRRIDSLDRPSLVNASFGRQVRTVVATAAFCTGEKPVLRLITGSGRSIVATPDHQFLTPNGWRGLGSLTTSDKVACPVRLSVDHSPLVVGWTLCRLRLLAHLLGNGCVLPSHSVQYTTADEDVAQVVAEQAREVFGDAIKVRIEAEGRKGQAPTWFQVFLPSSVPLTHGRRNPVADWFQQLGLFGLRSHEKFIPDEVFVQSTAAIEEFLSHLWSTDGTVSVRQRPTRGKGINRNRLPPGRLVSIQYSSSSRRVADGVHDLLLRIGVKSHVRTVPQKRGREHYVVAVCGIQGRRRFLEAVHPVGVRRALMFDRARRAMAEAGDNEIYQGDLYFDSVVSVEDAGVARVYDLSVPGPVNYVANGLIVHNSLEQDADVVVFLYRDEVYKATEANRGLAEVIVGKQRSGPIGTVEVLWDGRTTKFSDRKSGSMYEQN